MKKIRVFMIMTILFGAAWYLLRGADPQTKGDNGAETVNVAVPLTTIEMVIVGALVIGTILLAASLIRFVWRKTLQDSDKSVAPNNTSATPSSPRDYKLLKSLGRKVAGTLVVCALLVVVYLIVIYSLDQYRHVSTLELPTTNTKTVLATTDRWVGVHIPNNCFVHIDVSGDVLVKDPCENTWPDSPHISQRRPECPHGGIFSFRAEAEDVRVRVTWRTKW